MTPVPWKQWEGEVADQHFPLRRCLGSTDRSAVFLTQIGDSEPRNAAIKLILAGTDAADQALQWERAARLQHPHLLGLLRTGRCQVHNVPLRYAVTEYADENLADALAERPLAAAEVREMLDPLLGALAYIHGEGLVHGHVKPANILAVGDHLKLSVDGITQVGEPGLTPVAPGPYDPPEFQDRGCSPVGDVWSFGVTVVEALTQKRPVAGGPKQDPLVPEGIPADLLPIVRACLHPDPRRRPTVFEIRELLVQPVEEAQSVVAATPSSPPPRRRTLILAAASLVVLAGVFAAPRLLRRPVASAQSERPPAADPAPAPPAAENPQPPKPAPFAPAHEEVRAAVPATPAAAAPAPAPDPPPAPENPVTRPATANPAAEVLHQVLPDVSAAARRTIRGKVRVQVRATVDDSGHVSDARAESQNSRYFARLSLEAARKWQFTAGPGEWALHFEFTTSGTTVRPVRTGR